MSLMKLYCNLLNDVLFHLSFSFQIIHIVVGLLLLLLLHHFFLPTPSSPPPPTPPPFLCLRLLLLLRLIHSPIVCRKKISVF